MDISETLERLYKSKPFKDWKKSSKTSYLAHIFKMLDELNKEDWQVGFYNKDDTITSFIVSGSGISKTSSEGIFKVPGAKILKLDEKKVKIPLVKALEIAEKTQAEEYEKEEPMKIIVILQNTIDFGQVYNITYITKSFKTLNMRIDSEKGVVKRKSLSSLWEYKAE